ncbi:hypothetical protein EV361DRAFT_870646 [Lentinula raphanica]|nr:hypothetical protein EV361DRAFT_870646 [Lentinula raphanica]
MTDDSDAYYRNTDPVTERAKIADDPHGYMKLLETSAIYDFIDVTDNKKNSADPAFHGLSVFLALRIPHIKQNFLGILAILCSVSLIFNVPFTPISLFLYPTNMRLSVVLLLGLASATYGLPRGRQPPESHNEVPDDRFMREAILPPTPPPFLPPTPPPPTAPFPPPTAPPLPSIPPEPEAQRPIATYAFIQSPGPGSEGMQDSAAFMAELKTYSKAFIEDRIFRHIGITAKQDEDSNVEPLHSLINWGWNLTTKDAALVIAKTVRLDTWRFMSASAVVAARLSEDYWVVPTPIVVRVWLRSRDFEVYFDPDSQPLAPFPIPYDTNAIHGARFKVRYNPALDDPIDDSYAALLRLRGASLTHSDQH